MSKTSKAMKRTQAKSKQKMNALTALFAFGCVAETILLLVHHFYTQGTGAQMIGMHRVLTVMPLVGIVLLVCGVVIRRSEMERLRPYGVYVAALGAFLSLLSPLCLHVNSGAAGMLSVVVPVAMLLAVVYTLYAADFFWLALSVVSAIGALWYWNRCGSISYLRFGALLLMILAGIAALVILILTVLSGKDKGVVTICGHRLRMMEPGSCKVLLLAGHALSLIAPVTVLVNDGLSVYCMMVLSVVLFIAAIYYTVTAL